MNFFRHFLLVSFFSISIMDLQASNNDEIKSKNSIQPDEKSDDQEKPQMSLIDFAKKHVKAQKTKTIEPSSWVKSENKWISTEQDEKATKTPSVQDLQSLAEQDDQIDQEVADINSSINNLQETAKTTSEDEEQNSAQEESAQIGSSTLAALKAQNLEIDEITTSINKATRTQTILGGSNIQAYPQAVEQKQINEEEEEGQAYQKTVKDLVKLAQQDSSVYQILLDNNSNTSSSDNALPTFNEESVQKKLTDFKSFSAYSLAEQIKNHDGEISMQELADYREVLARKINQERALRPEQKKLKAAAKKENAPAAKARKESARELQNQKETDLIQGILDHYKEVTIKRRLAEEQALQSGQKLPQIIAPRRWKTLPALPKTSNLENQNDTEDKPVRTDSLPRFNEENVLNLLSFFKIFSAKQLAQVVQNHDKEFKGQKLADYTEAIKRKETEEKDSEQASKDNVATPAQDGSEYRNQQKISLQNLEKISENFHQSRGALKEIRQDLQNQNTSIVYALEGNGITGGVNMLAVQVQSSKTPTKSRTRILAEKSAEEAAEFREEQKALRKERRDLKAATKLQNAPAARERKIAAREKRTQQDEDMIQSALNTYKNSNITDTIDDLKKELCKYRIPKNSYKLLIAKEFLRRKAQIPSDEDKKIAEAFKTHTILEIKYLLKDPSISLERFAMCHVALRIKAKEQADNNQSDEDKKIAEAFKTWTVDELNERIEDSSVPLPQRTMCRVALRLKNEELTKNPRSNESNYNDSNDTSSDSDEPVTRFSLKSFGDDEGFRQDQESDQNARALIYVYSTLSELQKYASESIEHGTEYAHKNIAWITESTSPWITYLTTQLGYYPWWLYQSMFAAQQTEHAAEIVAPTDVTVEDDNKPQ